MRKYLLSAAALIVMAGAANAADDSMTVAGITIYGTVDMGLQYQTHGTPVSDYFVTGSEELISKNSNKAQFAATPSNLGQSKIGIKGSEEIVDGLSGVFKLETFFNPTSGDLSDAGKSMVLNNGVPLANQTSNAPSSINGQMFNSAAIVGLSSPNLGTATFGRQTGLLADNIAKYDPLGASNAFSVIGYSGTAAGSGDTEDRRFDNSLKYLGQFGPARVGGMYKFSGYGGSAYSAWEADVGADYAHLSIDAAFAHVKDALGTGPLSLAQTQALPALGLSASNSYAATVSDNTTYSVMAMYDAGAPKVFAGYEHISFANPSAPLAVGFADIGGYTLGAVNNTAFPNNKILQIVWTGLKYNFTPKFNLTGAYYHYDQNSYGNGTHGTGAAGCSTAANASCSGTLDAVSLVADYKLSKRFDVYAGAMWSAVADGLASGYLNTATIDPTVGMRFTF